MKQVKRVYYRLVVYPSVIYPPLMVTLWGRFLTKNRTHMPANAKEFSCTFRLFKVLLWNSRQYNNIKGLQNVTAPSLHLITPSFHSYGLLLACSNYLSQSVCVFWSGCLIQPSLNPSLLLCRCLGLCLAHGAGNKSIVARLVFTRQCLRLSYCCALAEPLISDEESKPGAKHYRAFVVLLFVSA